MATKSETKKADTMGVHNIGTRSRSQKPSHEDELQRFMIEIREIITTFQQEQNKKFDILQTAINDVRKQNEEIIKSVEFLSGEYNVLKDRLDKMERDKKNNLEYIATLENKIESQDRMLMVSSLEIKNIPPVNGESKTDLIKVMQSIAETLDVPVQTSDIRNIQRINTKKPENKPIIVDFTSVLTKEKLIEHCKKFNRTNKLTTSHLHIKGPSKPIFISENLTYKTRRLYFLARDFAKTNDYKYCWTAGGKVYIRKKEGEPTLRLNGEEDIKVLRNELKL